MSDSYITLAASASSSFTERRSEFIGNVTPITDEKQALKFIAGIKSKYSDAKHNVWAYILRDNNISRFSDDGEPHGTAGLPVLDVLRKSGITDSAVVVTRYFGGILLGAGGLVRAYTKAASDAVSAAGCQVIKKLCRISVALSYQDNSKCEQIFASFECRIADRRYADDVTTELLVSPSDVIPMQKKLVDATSGRAVLDILCDEYGTLRA